MPFFFSLRSKDLSHQCFHLRWRLRHRLTAAFLTVPTARSWRLLLGLLVTYSIAYLPIAFTVGFLKWQPQLHPFMIVRVSLQALFMPGLFEELLFRVLLIPHPTEPLRPCIRRLAIGLSWLLFVPYHLLPWTPAFFREPVFLLGAGLLGLVCTVTYLHSRSIWTPMILHWAIVTPWLLLFGGLEKFQR